MAKDKEFGRWSQRDIDAAIAKLVEQVKVEPTNWDEDGEYKIDMSNDIMVSAMSNLDNSDKLFDIQEYIDKWVFWWARDTVIRNPDKYCEGIVPNDDL